MPAGFYVYVHRRADTGAPFYVGKGSGARASCRRGRNTYWRNIVEKAGAYEVEFVVDGIDEELAHLAEVELIAKLRSFGVRLANLTDGGEGMAGFAMSPDTLARRSASQRGQKRPTVSAALKGRPKSMEHRAKLSAAKTGRSLSSEHRAALSRAGKGRPSSMLGKRHAASSIEKIRAASVGECNPFFGRAHSLETIERIRAANLGRRDDEATRLRKSEARKGERNPRFGVAISEGQKARQIATLKARPNIACPHCGKATNEGNARRWHFTNCKEVV